MTSQGHRYAQFQRALKTGNAHLALAAAAELRHVDLADALSSCLLLATTTPVRYDLAAVRRVALLLHRDGQFVSATLRELGPCRWGVGRHDHVASDARLERWPRMRKFGAKATESDTRD